MKLEWQKLTKDMDPVWTAKREATRYWVMRQPEGYWSIMDSHGAVYGEHATAEDAMRYVEEMK